MLRSAGPSAAGATPVGARAATVSCVLRDLMLGPPTPVAVLAAVRGAVYLRDAGGGVLAIVSADAARLPMAAVLSEPASAGTLERLAVPGTGVIGSGLLRVGRLVVSPRAWWDPRPVLGPLTGRLPADVPADATGLPARGLLALDDFARAVLRRDATEASGVAARLIGLGPGLTPAGDDVVAGLLGTLVCLGDPFGTQLARPIVAAAAGRTTDISQALLEHAAGGRCYGEIADLLAALTGGTPLREQLRALRRLGASSGPALAFGVCLGVQAALAGTALQAGRPT